MACRCDVPAAKPKPGRPQVVTTSGWKALRGSFFSWRDSTTVKIVTWSHCWEMNISVWMQLGWAIDQTSSFNCLPYEAGNEFVRYCPGKWMATVFSDQQLPLKPSALPAYYLWYLQFYQRIIATSHPIFTTNVSQLPTIPSALPTYYSYHAPTPCFLPMYQSYHLPPRLYLRITITFRPICSTNVLQLPLHPLCSSNVSQLPLIPSALPTYHSYHLALI